MNRLTQELLDMVAGYLPLGERVVTNSPARKWGVSQCASVSRAWQSSVERCTFRSFSVEDRDLSVLSTLLSTARRINSVRFLTYQILVDWEVAEEWIVDCYVRHKLWELLIWLSGLGMVRLLAMSLVSGHEKANSYTLEPKVGTQDCVVLRQTTAIPFRKTVWMECHQGWAFSHNPYAPKRRELCWQF